jgi:hypothetical protein
MMDVDFQAHYANIVAEPVGINEIADALLYSKTLQIQTAPAFIITGAPPAVSASPRFRNIYA